MSVKVDVVNQEYPWAWITRIPCFCTPGLDGNQHHAHDGKWNSYCRNRETITNSQLLHRDVIFHILLILMGRGKRGIEKSNISWETMQKHLSNGKTASHKNPVDKKFQHNWKTRHIRLNSGRRNGKLQLQLFALLELLGYWKILMDWINIT